MNVYSSFSGYHYYYKEKQANQKLFLCTLQFRESDYNDWSIVFQNVSLQTAQSALGKTPFCCLLVHRAKFPVYI